MKAKGYLAFMATMAMMSETNFGIKNEPIEENHTPIKDVEPPIQKGLKYYCFRQDGTFMQYERDGAMLKEEKFFSCYALNDKNAIKKFNKFKK